MELIEKRLNEAGFKLLGMRQTIEDLIIDILDKKNNRYLKAIPFLLYKHDVDMDLINDRTNNSKLFWEILEITSRIFDEFGINKKLPPESDLLGRRLLLSRKAPKLDSPQLNYSEFKDEFELQYRTGNNQELLIDRQRINGDMNLQFSLSQLFTQKEKQIIIKLVQNRTISKTEYEYYSRKTKKKINAILDLQDFARSVKDKKPIRVIFNEDLQKIKKGLENWLSKEEKSKNISILSFKLIEMNSIWIVFRIDLGGHIHNTRRNLSEIKSDSIRILLKECDNYDFER